MPKILILTYLVCFSTMLGSCQQSDSFQTSTEYSSYIDEMASKSKEQLKQSLLADLAYVDTLLVHTREIRIQVSFGMSFSSGNGTPSRDFDVAEPYQYSIIIDSVAQQLNEAVQELHLEQKFIHPNSTLTVDYPEITEGGTVSASIGNMFIGKKIVAPETVGLKRVDSTEVSLNYIYPKDFERWEIAEGSSATYGEEVATIDEWKGNQVEIYMPQVLYRKVLDFQAITKDGKLMNPTAKSAFPVTVIKRNVLEQLTVTRDLFIKALDQDDTEKAMVLLKQLSEDVFRNKNQLDKMLKAVDELEAIEHPDIEDSITGITTIMEEYASIFSPDVQSIDLTFPADIKKVYAYMGKDYDSIAVNGMAKDLYDLKRPYMSYKDSTTSKYGIIDSIGNIIIKAEYDDMPRPVLGTDYFVAYRKASYYLDIANKKMIEIKDKTFVKTIDDHRTVFSDSMDYHGVLKNNKTPLLPFAYDMIDAVGNVYLVKKSLRGRAHYEILDSDGKQILKDLKMAAASKNKSIILINSKDGKEGVMDADGNLTIPLQEVDLYFVGSESVLAYSYGRASGLVDINGKRLTGEVFNNIYTEAEGLFLVGSYQNDLYGYINQNGETIIPFRYQDAFNFNLGIALVLAKNGSFGFIDKSGVISKQIPKTAGGLLDIKDEGSEIRYIFENTSYDAQGNQIIE